MKTKKLTAITHMLHRTFTEGVLLLEVKGGKGQL